MSDIAKRTKKPVTETFRFWNVMNMYERFEQVIALILSWGHYRHHRRYPLAAARA